MAAIPVHIEITPQIVSIKRVVHTDSNELKLGECR